MTHSRGGFTLVEVLAAIVILGIGLLALAQSSGTVTRMIGRGKQDTQAAMVAQTRMETLRQMALSVPNCANLTSGTSTGPQPGTTATWTVSGTGNKSRSVVVTVTYRAARGGTRSETIRSELGCT